MFGSEMLEVVIGIIFIFLLVGVICTAIREALEAWLKSRAAFLEQGIRELLHDKGAVGIARSFYTHPLIYGLYADSYKPRTTNRRPSMLARGGGLPSYIPSRNFALALMDIAARGPNDQFTTVGGSESVLSLASVRANVVNLESAPVQRILLTAIDTAQGDLDKAVANIAAWFDSGMDRVSGAYRRATQKMLFVIGLAVAIGLNINTITIAHYLYNNDMARAAIVARAEAAARDSSFVRSEDAGSGRRYAEARAALDSLRLPIGWDGVRFGIPGAVETRTVTDRGGVRRTVVVTNGGWSEYVLEPLLGWLITALAAVLGAPFWFDVLNKVMVIRSTVKPHEKSPEESSEDRQSRAASARVARGDVGGAVGAVDAGPTAPTAPASAAPGQPAQPAQPAQPGQPAAPSPASGIPRPGPEDDIDGCDLQLEALGVTTDDELPAAQGGIAAHD